MGWKNRAPSLTVRECDSPLAYSSSLVGSHMNIRTARPWLDSGIGTHKDGVSIMVYAGSWGNHCAHSPTTTALLPHCVLLGLGHGVLLSIQSMEVHLLLITLSISILHQNTFIKEGVIFCVIHFPLCAMVKKHSNFGPKTVFPPKWPAPLMYLFLQ